MIKISDALPVQFYLNGEPSFNEKIEQGEIGLEESLNEYRRGVALTKRCHAILDTAEQELKKIKPGGEKD